MAKTQKLRPNNNHSNSTDDTVEYADTAAVQRNAGRRLPATGGDGGGYEEAATVGPVGADSNENLWEESNPYEGALAVDAEALMKQMGAGRSRGESIHMQNCGGLPEPDEDTTLVDNCMYSNAADMQRR